MKSNKGIFDRNSEYMTRNRWLNRHPPPLPHLWAPHHSGWCWKVGWVGLRYWPAMPSIRTDVALGSPNSETFVDIAPLPPLTRFSKQFLFPQKNELSSRTSEILHNKHELKDFLGNFDQKGLCISLDWGGEGGGCCVVLKTHTSVSSPLPNRPRNSGNSDKWTQ